MKVTSDELIKIITACGESEVESLEFGDVKLKFYNNKRHNQNGNIALSQDVMSVSEVDQDDLPHSPIEQELLDESADITEDMLAQLSIEDPQLFEEMSIRKLQEEG